jgi:hypothetical protein
VKRTGALCGAVALLLAGAAAGYIPSVGSLLRRAIKLADARPRDLTLVGTLAVSGGPAAQATLQLHRPLRCTLEAKGASGPSSTVTVAVRGEAGESRVEEAGASLGPARELVELACPLLTFRTGAKGEGERTLRAAAAAAGVQLVNTSISRELDAPVFVLGAQPRQLDVPQLWFYKDRLAPARLLARRDGRLDDLRLLQYGNAASAEVYPRVIELWISGRLAARFEATATSGGTAGHSGEDEDRE